MTLKQAKQRLIDQLDIISENPVFEATEILIFALKIKREEILYLQNQELTNRQIRAIKKCFTKRKRGVPLQYILGEWEFYSLNFKVGKGVLIPRADSELLVDLALEEIDRNEEKTVFDFCSGSGAIGIAIAKNRPNVKAILVEKSSKAFGYLKDNIRLNANESENINIKALRQDIFKFTPKEKADIIVCNPPYIDKNHMVGLQKEVKKEPRQALFGGNDGLKYYRMLLKGIDRFLKYDGKLMVEIGYNQGAEVAQIFKDAGLKDIQVIKDLAQKDRVVFGTLKSN